MDKADYGVAGVSLATYWQRRANNGCSGPGGGPCKKAESKRKHCSVSLVSSPTKALTRAVGRQNMKAEIHGKCKLICQYI